MNTTSQLHAFVCAVCVCFVIVSCVFCVCFAISIFFDFISLLFLTASLSLSLSSASDYMQEERQRLHVGGAMHRAITSPYPSNGGATAITITCRRSERSDSDYMQEER